MKGAFGVSTDTVTRRPAGVPPGDPWVTEGVVLPKELASGV